MKQLILDVLEDVSRGQPNLESEASRKMIANLIIGAIKSEPWFLDLSTLDRRVKKTPEECAEHYVSDKEKERAKWVCEICGENTFEVDFDYIGSEYNHLGCEMKTWDEIKDHVDEPEKMKEIKNGSK